MKKVIVFKEGRQVKMFDMQKSEKTAREISKEVYKSDESKSEGKCFYFDIGNEMELDPDQVLDLHKSDRNSGLLISRCRKIDVEVVYNGTIFRHEYLVFMRFRRVFNAAIRHFGIGANEKDDFELFLDEQNESKVDLSYPIGFYIQNSHEKLRVYLAKPNAFQG